MLGIINRGWWALLELACGTQLATVCKQAAELESRTATGAWFLNFFLITHRFSSISGPKLSEKGKKFMNSLSIYLSTYRYTVYFFPTLQRWPFWHQYPKLFGQSAQQFYHLGALEMWWKVTKRHLAFNFCFILGLFGNISTWWLPDVSTSERTDLLQHTHTPYIYNLKGLNLDQKKHF